MGTGRRLRLRRIFGRGRALIADCTRSVEDPAAWVRHLAREGVDAVVLTPGLLEQAADDLGALAVILRLDPGGRPLLLSVQAALEMGADAALLTFAPDEAFAASAEQARRANLPLVAAIACPNWLEPARAAADYGADVICTRFGIQQPQFRQFIRASSQAVVVEIADTHPPEETVRLVGDALQAAAQGVLLGRCLLDSPATLRAARALVQQGASLEEALAIETETSRVDLESK